MKKVGLGAAIVIVIFFIGYYIVSNDASEHPRINVSDVQSITINAIVFEAERNTREIAEFIHIYNSAKAFKKTDSTTPAYVIVIGLKSGGEINIEGSTQGFHYINDGEKSYKISSAELTYYLKNVMKPK